MYIRISCSHAAYQYASTIACLTIIKVSSNTFITYLHTYTKTNRFAKCDTCVLYNNQRQKLIGNKDALEQLDGNYKNICKRSSTYIYLMY